MGEFDLIAKFFTRDSQRNDVLLGVGDDAALINIDAGACLACALATVAAEKAGLPYPEGSAFAQTLARAAFNRLAAQGAAPAWLTLSLTLPKPDAEWLDEFSRALHAAAAGYGATLIGGDTTRGPLSATLIAHGLGFETSGRRLAPAGGDAVFVTGAIGLGLQDKSTADCARQHPLNEVPPRVNAGMAAAPHVSAAVDIRRSLAATLTDLLDPFELGADIEADKLPVVAEAKTLLGRRGGAKLLIETSDDPELCFLVPRERESEFCDDMAKLPDPCTRIGIVTGRRGVRVRNDQER